MKFAILEKLSSGAYFSGPHNSDYLIFLAQIFTDSIRFTNWIIDELSKEYINGISGNMIFVRQANNFNQVQIGDVYWFDTDIEPIQIDKQELLKIAKEGLALMLNQVPYLVLTRKDEYSPIVVTDQLPEGIELYTEHKQLKYRFKK